MPHAPMIRRPDPFSPRLSSPEPSSVFRPRHPADRLGHLAARIRHIRECGLHRGDAGKVASMVRPLFAHRLPEGDNADAPVIEHGAGRRKYRGSGSLAHVLVLFGKPLRRQGVERAPTSAKPIAHAEPTLRPEPHTLNSITTIRHIIAVALARRLPRVNGGAISGEWSGGVVLPLTPVDD